MKWPVAFVILISAVLIAGWHYHHTTMSQNVEMDEVLNAVKPLDTLLPANANITYQDHRTKLEVYLWLRYALAPRYIAWHTQQLDTVLTVGPAGYKDSLVLTGRKVLWQYADSQYCYVLSSVR